MKEAVISAVKEGGRIFFLAGLVALGQWIASKISGYDPSSTGFIVGTLVVKMLDKYVHDNDNMNANGVAPF